jgi:hypothetical protein
MSVENLLHFPLLREKDPILGLAANVTAMFILVLGLSGNSANLKSGMNAFV